MGIQPGARMHVVEDATETEWDTFVQSRPDSTIDHYWRWRSVFEDVFGHRCRYLIARRDGKVTGVLPLVCFDSRLFGRSLISVPFLNYGGVLAVDEATERELVEHATRIAHRLGVSHVELRHQERHFFDRPCRQHKLALTRPLPGTVEALWSGLDRKVRNQVRKAQKDGLTAEIGGAELVDEFYRVFATNMRDLGTPVYPRRLFVKTLRLFPEVARVFVVRIGRVATAAAIAMWHRDTVLVPWASSLRQYRHHCPNMLLYWAMMEHSVQSGGRIFDFGRSSPDSGTHHFKMQWGAQATPLHWEYVLLTAGAAPDHGPSNPRFAAAIDVWRRLPLWVANGLGPLIVRNIP